MRILLLCEGDAETNDSWSGVSRSLVQHLRQEGHTVITADVDLYGPTRWITAARTLAPQRRRWWVRYHLHRSAFRARSRRAANHLERYRDEIDVILQVGATFEIDPGPLPLVLYCDSNIELSRAASSTGYSEASVLTGLETEEIRSREARVYERADLIFTMSEMLRRSFIEHFEIPAERLVTVHCGPNVDVPEESPPEATAEPLNPTVLFVGRDFGRKGGDLLLRSFREVRASIPRARLMMIGNEKPASHEPWVTYIGYQDPDTSDGSAAIREAYWQASIFCLPTRFEPFGTVFVEAMLYGLPCVGPDAWAVPEIIEHDETGLLVEPEDPN
ncbi:MAG: glycosyltransferase family 4 protein, partial [Halobacteriales archaeon]|nr:glycosyltransferase family 4 protein [Halobacteriales archaeon]